MAENRKILNKQKSMELEISPDNNYAWLTILDSAEMIDENELIEFLNMTGIRYGFENAKAENEKSALSKKRGKAFLIAKGSALPPKPSFQLYFDPDDKKSVKQNSLLAKILPSAEPTIIGKNIFGSESKADDYQFEPRLYCGNNCQLNENNEIVAAATGIPIINEDKVISILSETTLDSIIDKKLSYETNLIVNGEINSSQLMVNGDLTVYGDIVNCAQGIYVTGNIKFLHASRSSIFSRGSITFDNCKYCTLAAEAEIVGTENSSIEAGSTASGQKIEIAVLGNQQSEPTSAEIAISPYLKEQIKLLQSQIKARQNEIDEIELKEMQTELENLENQYLQKVLDSLSQPEPKTIHIRQEVYPNSYLRIYNQTHQVTEISKDFIYEIAKSDK
ncbi:MAG: FapA family protein [Candidatus Cloacimonadales bacterium]